MRRVAFDYPNTCPQIDREISRAKAEIESFLGDLLYEACPLLPPERNKELAAANAEQLYGLLEDCFEKTRRANEDMRSEADRQIAALHDELTDAAFTIKSLEQHVVA